MLSSGTTEQKDSRGISFENTQIAFSGKSSKDLERAYWLFKLVSSNALVKIGKLFTHFALFMRLPIKGLIKATIFKQFCGGETITECESVMEVLNQYKIGTILDYSVEGKELELDFDSTMNETIATLTKAKNNSSIPFCVFKVTGLARLELLEKINSDLEMKALSEEEILEYKRVENRVERICKSAFEFGVPIFIDAEESWIQNGIDALAIEMMEKYNKSMPIVYNTIQMYRHDRLQFLKNSIELAEKGNYLPAFKIVRGAYMEKERARAINKGYNSPIQKDKEATDGDYNLALKYCLDKAPLVALCAGTHNEESSLYLASLIENKQLNKQDKLYYFAQLYGMSDHISYNLAFNGYQVAKYVPYGPIKEVLPYLIRRAEENTSVAGQTGRELNLIIKEKRRRKLKLA